MAGRPPKPTALKLLHGEKNKDRIRKNEPKPPPISLEPPASLDRYGREAWERTVPILEVNGLATAVDRDTLIEYCHLQSLNVHTMRALKKCGDKMLTEKHTVDGAGNEFLEAKVNPLVNQKLKIIAQLLPYFREFGMTPASRTKISVQGGGNEDEFFGS